MLPVVYLLFTGKAGMLPFCNAQFMPIQLTLINLCQQFYKNLKGGINLKNVKYMKLLFTCLIGLLSITGIAQEGIISGVVLDENGLGMPGATVIVVGTQRNTITSVNGDFRLLNVAPGKVTLEITYIGFKTNQREVEVKANETAEIRFILIPETTIGENVIVFGDRLKGQSKALNQQRSKINVSNIVAADQIGRFPDANIGDAMKRIPGITVLNDQGEARFGLIRGTEPRFNSVTINGERMPSAESGTRTIQLDLIPSDMIQTIEVSKALTPDMDADAIGGSANLVTRAAPKGMRVSGTLGTGYNFLSQKPMGIASLVVGNRYLNDKLGVIIGGSFHNHRFGSHNAEFQWDYNKDTDKPFLTTAEIRDYLVDRTRRSLSVGLDYKLGRNSTLTFRSLYNDRDDWENRFRRIYSGMAQPDANGLTRGRVEIETKGGGEPQKYRRREHQVTTANTLGGDHLINNKIRVDWAATYAYAKEDRPNERYISFRTSNLPIASGLRPNTSNPEFPFVETSVPLNYSTIPFRRFQLRNDFTDETDKNLRFNIAIPFGDNKAKASLLKFGGVYRNKEKVVEQNRGLLIPGTAVTWDALRTKDITNPNFLANGGGTKYNAGRFVIPEELEGFENRFNAEYEADEVDNAAASFTGKEVILGAYGMFTHNLTKKLNMLAGVRIENTDVNYSSTQFDEDEKPTPISGGTNYTNVMPSLHFKYSVDEYTIVRAAWTNTLARPNYESLAPARIVDNTEQTIFTGNPNLKPTTSMNLDLMFEKYFKNIGIFSAGGFYKSINDFVYTTSINNWKDPISGEVFLRATTPLNGPRGDLFGFEAAFQRQLDFLPGFLKGFGVYLNYTFTDSDTEVVFFNEDEEESTTINTVLPGTSKHNFNASLSYESKKFLARASINYHSGFLDPDEAFIALGTSPKIDSRFLDSQLHLDFNATYVLNPKWRIFLEVNNLTNQPLRFYQGVREQTMQMEFYNVRLQGGVKFDLFKVRE